MGLRSNAIYEHFEQTLTISRKISQEKVIDTWTFQNNNMNISAPLHKFKELPQLLEVCHYRQRH